MRRKSIQLRCRSFLLFEPSIVKKKLRITPKLVLIFGLFLVFACSKDTQIPIDESLQDGESEFGQDFTSGKELILEFIEDSKKMDVLKSGDSFGDKMGKSVDNFFLISGFWSADTSSRRISVDLVFKFEQGKWEIDTIGFDSHEDVSQSEKNEMLQFVGNALLYVVETTDRNQDNEI